MGAIADMIRAGVDPDLIERLFYELNTEPAKPKPMSAAERQAKKRAADKESRNIVTSQREPSRESRENVTDQMEDRHDSHENRDVSCGREIENTNLDSKIPSEASLPQGDGEPPPADPSIAERDLFRRGREVFGKSAGGQIAKLLRSRGGNVALARAVVEQASTAAVPSEWLAAAIRAGPGRTSTPARKSYFDHAKENHAASRNHQTEPDQSTSANERGDEDWPQPALSLSPPSGRRSATMFDC